MSAKETERSTTSASWSYAELWDRFPIPARPDPEETAMEEKLMKPLGDGAKVMILGSTIEYRSLCKRLGVVPHVVDFSRANYDSLSSYAKEKFEKEIFIESDWLKVDDGEKFDVILGHRPFNVIRHDQVQTLFTRMYRALKLGGTFFCRGNVKFPGDEDRLEAIVQTWGAAKNRPYRLFSYLEVPLYMHCADDEGYLDYPKARAIMAAFHERGWVNDEDYADLQPLISMPAGTKFRSFVAKEELEKYMRAAGFTKIDWRFTSHEFTKNMPIIVLTK